MKTILVMTDFTLRADNAARYALGLAQKIEANLLLCNVFFVPSRTEDIQVTWPAEEYKTIEMNSEFDLRTLKSRLSKGLDVNLPEGSFIPEISYCARAGSLTDVMNELVYHNNIVTVVVGKHDTFGLSDFLTGNHTNQIIEKADCPVLVIPSELSFQGLKKIAFATDLAQNNIDALQSLVSLAMYSGAEILITHIADEKSSDQEEQVIIKRFFNQVSAKTDYPRIYYKAVKNRSVTAGLDWVAEHTDVDLMVLIHRKRSFFEGLIDNSVTRKVANHAIKPLLVFPSAKVAEVLPVF
jgi:nucleotide-binding universal stress UspA family protein